MQAKLRMMDGRTLSHQMIGQMASGVSHVFCPPCVASGGMLLAAALQPSPRAWWCAAIYIVLAVFGPLCVLFHLMGLGQVSDLDVTRREERHKPFLAAVCGAALAWSVLAAMGAPALLVHFALAHTLVISLVLLITLYWKISVHAAGAAAVATLLASALPSPLLAFLPVLVVAWSRLYLGRHTLTQVMVGGGLGAAVFALLL